MSEESESNIVQNPNKRKSIEVEEGDQMKKITRYSCIICEKTFDTPQALGGHQRCHKHERDIRGIKPKPRWTRKLCFTTEKCKADMKNIDAWFKANRVNYPQLKEADQKGAKSEFEFVLLSRANDQIKGSGSQQATRTEIDFGLVSKGRANSDAEDDKETNFKL